MPGDRHSKCKLSFNTLKDVGLHLLHEKMSLREEFYELYRGFVLYFDYNEQTWEYLLFVCIGMAFFKGTKKWKGTKKSCARARPRPSLQRKRENQMRSP